jgi:hypothetical protein
MRKTYKYIIEFSKPVWPRHIADTLTGQFEQIRETELICVKDLQLPKGHTYQAKPRKPKNWFGLIRRQSIGM